MNMLSPFRVQKFLAGLRYPVRKPQVLAYAHTRGADEQVIRALQGIADRAYDSPIALSCEVAQRRA
jgi:hypothetical protein